MVGDIAGILNLVMARNTDVAWSPEIKMSALVVDGEVQRRNVPLRGWQRADLSNGEKAMMAERREETPFRSGSRRERRLSLGPKAGLASVISAVAAAQFHGRLFLTCSLQLYPFGVDKRAVSSSIFTLYSSSRFTCITASWVPLLKTYRLLAQKLLGTIPT